MPDPPYRRRSARVLLLDGDGRILLLRSYLDSDDPGLGHCWVTPGGGVSEGETLAQAAARELREETGLAVAPDDLGPPVAHTDGYADLGFASGMFRDDFFVHRIHRIPRQEVDLRCLDPHEHRLIVEYRWWTLPALASTTELVYPLGLAPLLETLLAGPPVRPVRLPWHH